MVNEDVQRKENLRFEAQQMSPSLFINLEIETKIPSFLIFLHVRLIVTPRVFIEAKYLDSGPRDDI
jgi:hypothetical protein